MMLTLYILLACVIYYAQLVSCALNNRPIIGVLAQTLSKPLPGVNGTSFLSAAYVKFLESAGARVVPIPTSITADQLERLFGFLNGVLFPGGDVNLMNSPYQRNAKLLYDLAIKAHDTGDYFPIWGTCLGIQQLSTLAAKSDAIISHSSGTWDQSMELNFTNDTKTSKMYSNAPINVLDILQSEAVTYNAHYNCVSIDAYKQSHSLSSFFKVLSTNEDSSGKVFISTIEGRNYPFYGVQWHPEINIFEYTMNEGLGTNVNHSKDAIVIAQYHTNFFVNEARKSLHHFPTKLSEQEHLIYNYTPYHSGLHGWFDEQIYIF